jgi:hypothetical protein
MAVMVVVHRIQQLEGRKLVLELPEDLANHRVEVMISTVEETAARRPHPRLAGRTAIQGDLLDSAPGSDWELP